MSKKFRKKIKKVMPEYSKKKLAKACEILKMISENPNIFIDELRIALDVTDRTIARYISDLSKIHMFNPYGSIPILDDDGDRTGWNIYMFRADDKDIQNIINSSYAVKMELPEYITDYDSFFEDLGFTKEAVRNEDVCIIKSNSRYITISYDDKSKEIEKSRLEKYKVMVQTKCVVLKIKALWNSSENNLYGIDKKRVIKCIPDIENYEYVPVNNSMLAKAEIPFLIFERNRGKCFIEMY